MSRDLGTVRKPWCQVEMVPMCADSVCVCSQPKPDPSADRRLPEFDCVTCNDICCGCKNCYACDEVSVLPRKARYDRRL